MATQKTKGSDRAANSSFIARVEEVKLSRNWTWEEVAQRLQMTRMMLHRIKTEQSGVSKRNIYRLEQLEIAEGVKRRGAKEIIDLVVSSLDAAKVKISTADFDRGYIEVPVEYARGEAPDGYPPTIRLVRPSVKSAAKIVADLLVDKNYEGLVLSCIQPARLATEGFINLLTPFSYQALVEASMALVFGAGWRSKLVKRTGRK